jgi:hypothetical protein
MNGVTWILLILKIVFTVTENKGNLDR